MWQPSEGFVSWPTFKKWNKKALHPALILHRPWARSSSAGGDTFLAADFNLGLSRSEKVQILPSCSPGGQRSMRQSGWGRDRSGHPRLDVWSEDSRRGLPWSLLGTETPRSNLFPLKIRAHRFARSPGDPRATFMLGETGLEKSPSSGVRSCERECVLDRDRKSYSLSAPRKTESSRRIQKAGGVALKQTGYCSCRFQAD